MPAGDATMTPGGWRAWQKAHGGCGDGRVIKEFRPRPRMATNAVRAACIHTYGIGMLDLLRCTVAGGRGPAPTRIVDRQRKGHPEMPDTTIKKIDAAYSPQGTMGQKYLASGTSVAMRQ